MAISQEQLGEFEAAFQRFSQGQDTLSRDSLKTEMRALGFKPTDGELREMMKEASSSGSTDNITFTEFHTMLSDRMSALDPEDEIVQVFFSQSNKWEGEGRGGKERGGLEYPPKKPPRK